MTGNRRAIHGWGRHASFPATIAAPSTVRAAQAMLEEQTGSCIPRGMGRAYGDSAMAAQVLSTRRLNLVTAFDSASGILRCGSGMTLDAVLQLVVPRGWFLPVVPGTRFVSVGGAIASDVHGKNHHRDGSFSEFVDSLDILLGNGEVVRASRSEHADLFHASCGGMGLTGLILAAQLRLRGVPGPDLMRKVRMHGSLDETLQGLTQGPDAAYSVAWLDTLAGGRAFGRSILEYAEHVQGSEGAAVRTGNLPVPGRVSPLQRWSMRCFNELHWWGERYRGAGRVHYQQFFFPLDRWANWNRLYGRSGMAQYQFVVPGTPEQGGVAEILARVRASAHPCFLAVLKMFGPGNANPLSFPRAGCTVALDFRIRDGLAALFAELDAMVIEQGGRVYLAKDLYLQPASFRSMYPDWEAFQQVRERYHARGRFVSLQSQRLALD